jgi:hypothetical protein
MSMDISGTHRSLTTSQQRFANDAHADVGGDGAGDTVCLYRQDEECVVRWIVDGAGRLQDLATFPLKRQ